MFLTLSYAHAQYVPAGDVSLSYSRWQAYNGCACGVNGLKGGADFNLNRWFGVTADLGYYNKNVNSESGSGASSNAWATTFLAGPRFTFRNRSEYPPLLTCKRVSFHASSYRFKYQPNTKQRPICFWCRRDIALDRGGHLALRPLRFTSLRSQVSPCLY